MDHPDILKQNPFLGRYLKNLSDKQVGQLIEKFGVEKIESKGPLNKIFLKEEGYLNSLYLLGAIHVVHYNIRETEVIADMGKRAYDKYIQMTIHYCISGHCELQVQDGKYAYMEPGILCVEAHTDQGKKMKFYGRNYSGLEVSFEINRLKREDKIFLERLGISFDQIQKLQEEREDYYIGRVTNSLKCCAEELARLLKEGEADLYTYLIELVRYLNLIRVGNVDGNNSRIYLTKGQRKIVTEVYKYFAENLNTDVTVEQMAQKHNLSVVSLNKYFSVMHGETINRYFTNYRLEKAASVMKEGRGSIADIAWSVGYQNQSKFSSAFKKKYGVTPMEFCRRNQKK